MISGESLEKDVERVYKLLGAKHTERRKLIESYEIDVYAEFSTGHINYKVIVECKEFNKKKKVSDVDMRSFVSKLILARNKQVAQIGVFVTTSSYSKDALKTANDHDIKCLSIDDLYNQLVNFDEYITTGIEEFEKTQLFKHYINQTCCEVEDYSTLLKSEFEKVSHKSSVDYLISLLHTDKIKRIAVLGNFGTGKTSLCYIINNTLLKISKSDPKDRIPIFISLRDFRSGIDIDQLITNHLQKLPGIDINLQLCKELQRMGRFIFILDGLDEMSTKVDRVVINENLRELDKLYTEGDNYYIITCRTHFFQDRISDEFLSDYKVIYLTEWSEKDLEYYLKKRFGNDWEKYSKKINSQLAIKELAKTPIFLDMILNSLASIAKEDEFSIQKLYKAYTDEWIEKQSKRRGAIMTANQRKKFLLELSSKMYLGDTSIIHYTELYNVSKEISGYIDNTRVDYFDTDARTSTFITKDSGGNYGFYHRSFMEYFCAAQLCDEINIGQSKLLAHKDISIEIFEFINFELISKQGLKYLQGWSKHFKEKYLSRNSVQVLLKLSQKIDTNVLKFYNISESNWKNLNKALESNDADVITRFIENNLSLIYRLSKTIIERYDFKNVKIERDEIVSDLLIKLWKDTQSNKKNLTYESLNTESYIYKILKIIISEKYRTGKKYDDLYDLTIDQKAAKSFKTPREEVKEGLDDIQKERLDKIYAAVKEIKNDDHREAFLLVYRDGEPITTVARKFNIDKRALNLILYRIRTRLRNNLKEI